MVYTIQFTVNVDIGFSIVYQRVYGCSINQAFNDIKSYGWYKMVIWWYWNSTVYVYIILYSSTTSKRWIRWYRWILRHSTSVMGTSSSSAIQILPVEVTPLPWPHRTAGSHSTGKLVLIPSNWPKKSTLDIFRTLYICMYIYTYIHMYVQ